MKKHGSRKQITAGATKPARTAGAIRTALDCLASYITVATDFEYWEGIYRRVQTATPLTFDELFNLNQLVRDWTGNMCYSYNAP